MRFATWNVEGLQTKEALATNFANTNHFQAFVLTETWLKPNSCPQPADNAWQRLDCASGSIHPNARRHKGGISLLTRRELATSSVATDRYHRWCIWRVDSYFIAGVYIEPSASPDIFHATMRTLGSALTNAIENRPGPVCVLGDFNSRLGPFTGDIITSNRSSMLIDFSIEYELSILNASNETKPRSMDLHFTFGLKHCRPHPRQRLRSCQHFGMGASRSNATSSRRYRGLPG